MLDSNEDDLEFDYYSVPQSSKHINSAEKYVKPKPKYCSIPYCRRKFKNEDTLKKHEDNWHRDENLGWLEYASNMTWLKFVDAEDLKCKECGMTFKFMSRAKTHVIQNHLEKKECNVCGIKVSMLEKHKEVHKEGRLKNHPCKKCDKGFSHPWKLKLHEDSVHLKQKPHQCIHCGQAFAQRGNRNAHERNVHKTE